MVGETHLGGDEKMVKHRNPILIVIFTIITLGIYGIYWLYSTKKELVELGASVPTFFLIIIPIINIYWVYKYAKGVAHIAKNSMGIIYFILWLVLAPIAMILTQIELNKFAK